LLALLGGLAAVCAAPQCTVSPHELVQTYACDPNLLSISVETSLRGRLQLQIQQSAALSANEISVSVSAPGVPSTTIARLCASFEASSGSLRVSAEAVSAVLDAPEFSAAAHSTPHSAGSLAALALLSAAAARQSLLAGAAASLLLSAVSVAAPDPAALLVTVSVPRGVFVREVFAPASITVTGAATECEVDSSLC
jgi:hypothetical protein